MKMVTTHRRIPSSCSAPVHAPVAVLSSPPSPPLCCSSSAAAAVPVLCEQLKHALSGVEKGRKAGTAPVEIMGLMIGKADGDAIVVLDANPLPVEGSETRVVADDAQVYMLELMESLELRRKEGFIGWYHCLSTLDTRVLTDAGWLFHDEVVDLVADGRAPRFACYDVATRSLVYRAGHTVGPFDPPELLDFTHADERRNWSECSDAYGAQQTDGDDNSNHLSLRVTPNHKMYVQLGTETSGSNIAWHQQAGKRVAPIQVEAATLLPGATSLPPKRDADYPDYTHIGFLAAAHEGFGEPANVCDFLREQLGLPSVGGCAQLHRVVWLLAGRRYARCRPSLRAGQPAQEDRRGLPQRRAAGLWACGRRVARRYHPGA